jgi:hypothetical protein
MTYSELTDNQKSGIDYWAAHNLRSINQYLAWRETDIAWDIEQDGNRGYTEMQELIAANIPLPETVAEPEQIDPDGQEE